MSAPAPSVLDPARTPLGWRTPLVIVVCGCGIALLAFGPRSALGFFLTPMSQANGWGRDVFGLALAIQNLLWGIAQPFAGALADRFGTIRVIAVGALLYAGGLALMAWSTSPLALDITAGVMIGFGLAGCSFNLVIASFGKLLPVEWRSLSFGAGTAAGSFGQFLFSPLAVGLNQAFGWQTTLLMFGTAMLMILPLSIALATPRAEAAAPLPGAAASGENAAPQSLRQALAEALGHRSYVLLVLGFFTCGFQLAFITVHMPAYLVDRGLSAAVGGWTLAIIGLFNIVGSLASGWLGNRWPKRYLLAANYFSRAIAIAIFVSLPASPVATLVFGAVLGLLWLSTVPPTSGLVLLMFGTRWFAMLSGFVFFSHQVGGFLGVWIGGIAFERTGSYDLVWWLAVLFGVLSAVINLPIVEKPVARLAAARA
ncbi:MFS transporter [Rhodoplanes sp. TEM]|uniref:MFS transporter n=1 Tax=Rhodoplanes tepidamans TaxID=200616 RepID=A0ABT5JAW5_RHOTP|nr:MULTISPECIES: MFS transporter [Rhodoplanes]MDC7786826.1 MFS transporter [Rhodoplanes tepidamans]MDC7985974.1 MFS transporter [Rhodoplanes sp. TEM]MDQ0355954.1 MFS family permease [Rhodoplanes tepidamans]